MNFFFSGADTDTDNSVTSSVTITKQKHFDGTSAVQDDSWTSPDHDMQMDAKHNRAHRYQYIPEVLVFCFIVLQKHGRHFPTWLLIDNTWGVLLPECTVFCKSTSAIVFSIS